MMSDRAESAVSVQRRGGAAQGLTLAIAGFLPILSILSLAPAVPTLIAHFKDVPNASIIIPLLVTTPGLMVALLAPVAGLIVDRFGRRRPLLLATFLYAFAGTAPMLFGDLWAVLTSRIFVGVAETFVLVITNALFADYFEPASRRTWITVQGLLGPLLGAASIAAAGGLASIHWSTVFGIYALAFPVFLAMLIWCFEPPAALAAKEQVAHAGKASKFPWRTAAIYCSVTVFSSIIYYVFTVQGGLAFQAIGVTSAAHIGAIMGSVGLGVLLGASSFNILSRRLPSQWLIACYLIILGVGTGGMGLSSSATMMTIFALLQQVGAGMTVTALVFWVSRLLPVEHRGRGFGLWTSAFFGGQFISPAIVGLIGAVGVNLLASFRILGLLSVLAAIVVILVARVLPAPIDAHQSTAH